METRLAEILATQGRRRDWLAAQTGVDPATVTRYCQGVRTPPPEFRARAAEALGVTESELFPAEVPAATA